MKKNHEIYVLDIYSIGSSLVFLSSLEATDLRKKSEKTAIIQPLKCDSM